MKLVNGKKPKNLRHFAEIISDSNVTSYDILLEHGRRVFLQRESCENAKEELIQLHGLKDLIKISEPFKK